jgi:histone acetyltransferase (RNA polymerase elongator complex component)
MYAKGAYKPLSLDEAVDTCRELVKIFDENNIKIIRLGLLMSDSEAKNNFVAGPYHPRFRELL